MSRIIKVEVRVVIQSRRLSMRLITLTETLIILNITKTESNNCFILYTLIELKKNGSHVYASSLTTAHTWHDYP